MTLELLFLFPKYFFVPSEGGIVAISSREPSTGNPTMPLLAILTHIVDVCYLTHNWERFVSAYSLTKDSAKSPVGDPLVFFFGPAFCNAARRVLPERSAHCSKILAKFVTDFH